jgi:hypothetical protein
MVKSELARDDLQQSGSNDAVVGNFNDNGLNVNNIDRGNTNDNV